MDFADFSGPHGDVVEVRNTFLHVRTPSQSNLEAAARSDFVCNYGEYPELASGSPSTPTSKSRSRRPGKKARARMVRRSTLTSISTDTSISTEIPLEPHLEVSESGLTSDTQCESLSESAAIDGDDSRASSLASTAPPLPTPPCTNADPQELPRAMVASGGGAGAFVVGALCTVALLGLFWSIGIIQIQVPFSTGRHCHADATSNALQTLKEEMERRLASQELMMKDLMSQVRTAQVETIHLNKGSDEGYKVDAALQKQSAQHDSDLEHSTLHTYAHAQDSESAQSLSREPEAGAALGISLAQNNRSLNYFPHGSSKSDLALAASVNASRREWFDFKSLCSIWIGLVLICSMVQEPFRSLISDKVHEKPLEQDAPMPAEE